MVPRRRDAVLPQGLTEPLHRGPGGTVDDAAAPLPLPQQLQHGGALVPGLPHVEKEVGPVKARHRPHRVPEPQQRHDVPLHQVRGRGGEGPHGGPPGQGGEKVRDAPVAGPEVLPPLGDAVGLVHRHERDGQLLRQGGEVLRLQPLRSHIEEPVGPLPQPVIDRPPLRSGKGAVEKRRRDARLLQCHHLVLHQGDEGRDHQRHPRQQQCRHLIAEGLAPAGGHDAQGIPPRQQGVDQGLLPLPEFPVAEAAPQNFLLVHAVPSVSYQIFTKGPDVPRPGLFPHSCRYIRRPSRAKMRSLKRPVSVSARASRQISIRLSMPSM